MIKVILWDVDGTLLNFKKAESYAIKKCFSVFHLGECTDEMVSRYSAINTRYWERLESGEITKAEVLRGRFEEFFAREQISFDEIDAFNSEYQVSLGDEIFFSDNGYETVAKLKNQVRQYAVTNGTYTAQKRKLERSGLEDLFDGVFISDLIGADKPKMEFFDYVWQHIGSYEKEEVMIVGDSLTSDMQGGNNAGIVCCWYNPEEKESPKNLKIDFNIRNLGDVPEIIQKNL